MSKSNDVQDYNRSTKKNKKKNTLKKYGKNTPRGVRIKENKEKQITKKIKK